MIESLLVWRLNTWGDYYFLYGAAGLLLLIYLRVRAVRIEQKETLESGQEPKHDIGSIDQPNPIALYCLAILIALVAWPLYLCMYAHDRRLKKDHKIRLVHNQSSEAFPIFYCAPQYFFATTHPEEAEKANVVFDPLGGAPNTSFGHLHQAWVKFLQDMKDKEDVLWAFRIPKGSIYGEYQWIANGNIEGYAIVRSGEIFSEFIYFGN